MADDVLQYTVTDHATGTRYVVGTVPPEKFVQHLRKHNPRALGAAPAGPISPAGAVTISTEVTTTQTVTEDPEDTGPAVYPEGAPDDTWTVKDLRAWAKANDLTLGEAKVKPQILEVIAEHLGETSPTVDEASNEEHDDTRPDSPESE